VTQLISANAIVVATRQGSRAMSGAEAPDWAWASDHADVVGCASVSATRARVSRCTDFHTSKTCERRPQRRRIRSRLPFVPRRYFLTFNAPARRFAASMPTGCATSSLFALTVVHVMVDDGDNRDDFRLDSRLVGVYLPPMTWRSVQVLVRRRAPCVRLAPVRQHRLHQELMTSS